jgi:polysaccharide export outer membrane protein
MLGLALFAGLLSGLVHPCPAVAATEPAGPSASREAGAPYILVAGDVLEITVEPQTNYSRTVTIQPDGKIVMPVVGEQIAAGLTVQQLTDRLRQGLEVELKRPRVTVSLKETNKGLLRRVSVMGAVKNPGVYELKDRSSLMELVAAAGGATPVADLRRVAVTRVDGSGKAKVDLLAARTGDTPAAVTLEPGDLIFVPEGASPTVALLGEVVRPGNYDLKGEMRILDALSLAGGPTPKGDLTRVLLMRAGQAGTQTLNIQALLTPGGAETSADNVVLAPGDAVVVSDNPRKYYVLGEVSRPESYPLKPNDRLLDALTNAGGTTREANLGRVQLIRKGPQGQPVARSIDVRAMLSKGDMALNEPLQEGDIIFLPNRKQPPSLASVLGFIGGLISVLY